MNVTQELGRVGLLAVIEVPQVEGTRRLVEAFLEGGVSCLEITLRTTAALDAIRATRSDFPQLLLGAGTVLSIQDADMARAAGADFIVSPGFSVDVVRHCRSEGIPIFPGVCTPTEVQMAVAEGISAVKFFPAEAIGGIAYLKALAAPFPGVQFIATGGIDAKNLVPYLAVPQVLACGGSWMATRDMVLAGDYSRVTELAAQARELARQSRAGRG